MPSTLKNLYLSYLRFFARKALAKHKPTIIGIAGSVGKSSTAHALFAVLKEHGPTKLVGNSETGIPLGILGMQPKDYTKMDWMQMLLKAPFGMGHLKDTKYLIAEMGIDEPFPPKNMGYLLTILKPDIAIVLNESATHSLQFEKSLSEEEQTKSEEEKLKIVIEKIAAEDCKIITESNCKIGIYNADDENISAVIASKFTLSEVEGKQSLKNAQLLSFGKDKSNAVSYKDNEIGTAASEFSFKTSLKPYANETLALKLPGLLLPKEYEQTFAAVIAAAAALEVPKEILMSGLHSFSLPGGRSSLLTAINNSIVIDSSYNASKAAVFAFLAMVHQLKKQTKRPIVFLFGDMRELGEETKIEHEAVAEKLSNIVDYLYLVGPLTRDFVIPYLDSKFTIPNSSLKEVRWFANAKFAGEYLKDHIPQNAIVLVKGSQNTIFLEEAIRYILADQEDAKHLCRQSAFWLEVKKKQGILS